ncbi:MAG: DUF4388 domain-containing protein [Chloroflexaceae bacterium]|nr:DUF4388 domain-containing protein [Chloroflexaceae bacterium]NJO04668.1 DUF4388 domain-containing protein [Chloroflexaceae bacterium]
MALVGNIQDFGLSDFLYLVDRGYKTGCLHLNRANETAVLFFDKGKLTYAAPRPNEKMGDVLVQLGAITNEQLTTARDTQHSNGATSVAQVLIDQNILSSSQLQSVLQTHVEEYVYSLFGWTEGEFLFEHGQKPDADAPVMPVPIPVENIIMEGVRRIDEWGRIKDRIASTDMIPRFIEQPGEKAKGVKLAPEEWRVFARIARVNDPNPLTLAQIAQQTGMTEFDVCRVVYGFVTAGLVEVVKRQRVAAETQAAAGGSRLRRSLVSRIIKRIQSM